MNMWKKNRRQIVAGIIAVILVLAMVVPMVAGTLISVFQ